MAIRIKVKENLYSYNLSSKNKQDAFLIVRKGESKYTLKLVKKLVKDAIEAENITAITKHNTEEGKSHYNIYLSRNELWVLTYKKYENEEEAISALKELL